MKKFISKEYGDLKIEVRFNHGGIIISHCHFMLRINDKPKNRYMTV
jgi:uncharacterized protein YjfI (DUF2170 family)